MNPDVNVTYERAPDVEGAFIARLEGSLNALTADQLWESSSVEIAETVRFVVLDFTGVTMLTSAGIGMMVRLYTRLKDREGSLAVFGCSKKIREIIAIVMLEETLHVCDSEEQAWESIKQAIETTAI